MYFTRIYKMIQEIWEILKVYFYKIYGYELSTNQNFTFYDFTFLLKWNFIKKKKKKKILDALRIKSLCFVFGEIQLEHRIIHFEILFLENREIFSTILKWKIIVSSSKKNLENIKKEKKISRSVPFSSFYTWFPLSIYTGHQCQTIRHRVSRMCTYQFVRHQQTHELVTVDQTRIGAGKVAYILQRYLSMIGEGITLSIH